MNIWGFSKRSKGNWNQSHIGDHVAFYVTAPVKRIIGFGRITNKFISENLVWPDEKMFKKSIWEYKLEFKKQFLVDRWEDGILVPSNIMLNTGRKLVNEITFLNIIKQFRL